MSSKKKRNKKGTKPSSTKTALVRRSSSALVHSVDQYLSEVSRFPLLTREQERELAMKYFDDGDVDAAHTLVTSNLRFVVKVALQYAKYGVKLSDLIQEGNVGLMTAVKKFDPTRGYRLISYAVWWIKAYIQKYLLDNWSIVRLGTTSAQRKMFRSLKKIERQLQALEGEAPSDEEIAKTLDIKVSEVSDMRGRLLGRDVSLDGPVDDDSRDSKMDLVPSPQVPQDEMVIRKSSFQMMLKAVQDLKPRLNEKEAVILSDRLLTDEPATLQVIGDRFQISRERVRQIEEALKKKLRKRLEELLDDTIDIDEFIEEK